MKKTFLFLILLWSCKNSYKKEPKGTSLASKYCIVNDQNNEMTLLFHPAKDSIFVLYMNILDNGNILNGFADSSDFAGHFLAQDISKGETVFEIINYQDKDDKYKVVLDFNDNGNQIKWSIKDTLVAFLPKNAIFKQCENN